MPEVELSAGTIRYEDEGPRGAPVVVLLHGLVMDHTLWDGVVPALVDDFRVVRPTMPLGAHQVPMRPGTDLRFARQCALVGELLEALDLHDVTLVFNDWGGAQGLIAGGHADRVGRLVLTSCEAFDNYPPGLPGKGVGVAAKVPGGLFALLQPLRLKALRGLPMAFGWMTKRGVPHDVLDGWLRPALTQKAIRRDLRAYAGNVPPKAELLELAEAQRRFDRPVLVVWAKEDRVMPPAHATRLVELFPDARLRWIEDSYTLLPIDQPAALAAELRAFALVPA